MKKFLKRGDIILLVTVILICAVLFIIKGAGSKDQLTAVIYKDGKVIDRINLSEVDESYTYDLESTPESILSVEHGKISYKYSECPDKLCVKTGVLSKPGDTAACLPAKTMIIIEGSSSKTSPDIITY